MAIFAKLQRPKESLLLFIIVFTTILQVSNAQYYLEEKKCAIIHSEANFEGEEYVLNDRDQSIDLSDDGRISDDGWNNTGSIKIESSCSMEICNETYFDGSCLTLPHGSYPTTNSINLTAISSASCTCHKECKCEDIYMKKSSCARAYLEGGCRTCNSLYTDLSKTTEYTQANRLFPDEFLEKLSAFRIRKGCTLTLYEDEDLLGESTILDSEVVEDFSGEFHSYECNCDDSLWEPRVKPPRPASYPPLVDIPGSLDDIIKLMTEKQYDTHPGLRAAHTSFKNGRSSKNAYIMLLGSTGSGKSSAINLLFDNPNVTAVGGETSTTTDIHEFRIPVPIDEFGIGNSELRVIDTPGLGDTRGLEQDAKFLTTLDAYLTNHEELKDRIPNVVLLFHKFHDNRFNGEGSGFVKMLRGLDSFKSRVTDENYSNVIFVLSHFCSETKANQKRPDIRLARFKSVIENYSLLPHPIIISVAENKAKDQELPMVNGFFKLPNHEYYPKNLFMKLEQVTEKGGDPIGLGVFRTAFRDSDDFNVTQVDFKLMDGGNKIDYYFKLLTNAVFSINKTEISQLLQHTWDEKLPADLKKQFPASLPYLQKALSIRNVNTKEDVPKTSTGILELLTAIKHDQATRVLLDKSLQIKAPTFPHNTIAGYSYSVFKDIPLHASPFTLGDVQGSNIGFMIPKILTCNLDPSAKQNFLILNTREEYIHHRLQSLGIDGTIPSENFTGALKPGHNIKGISMTENNCTLSATREFRLFDFVLNEKLDLTEDFIKTVKALPLFDNEDHEVVDKWKKFFDEYGTHVVKSVHGGGSIGIQLHSDKKCSNKIAEALFDLVKFAEDMSFMITTEEEESENDAAPETNGTTIKVKSILPEGTAHTLTFQGGDPQFHTNDLTKMSIEKASKLLSNWKKSLKYNPTVLTTEMRLVPISQIVKKIGQNYSTEIDRATGLLFNSELIYVPPRRHKPSGPGNDRQNTDVMSAFLQMQAESNQRIQELMFDLRKTEAANQQRQMEMEQKRIEWQQEQARKDQEFKLEQLRIQKESEDNRNRYNAEAAAARAQAEADRNRQQMEYNAAMAAAQAAAAARTQEMLVQLANKPDPPTGSCFKAGTKILMADMTEKPVETLQVGDLVLDMDLKPTTVLAVPYDFLREQKFYGFDNKTFFFTNTHLFAGPSANSNLQLYAQDTTKLFQVHPLIQYLNVAEMGAGDKTTDLFHLSQSSEDSAPFVSTESVNVFEDPLKHPHNTPVYFIEVDSPSGTYFANGYVCRHEIPPIEIWPNTMSVLFRLMENPMVASLSEVPYDLDRFYVLNDVTTKVADAVRNYVNLKEATNWEVKNESDGTPIDVMTLADIDAVESISKIYGNPSVSTVGVGLYSKAGKILAPYLDSAIFGRDPIKNNLAFIQRDVFQLIENELRSHLINSVI